MTLASSTTDGRWGVIRDERSTTSSLSGSSTSGKKNVTTRKPDTESSTKPVQGSDLNVKFNPFSSAFKPFASPPRTMPDISHLSFSDRESVESDEVKSRTGNVTPQHKSTIKVVTAGTPGLTASTGTHSTPSTRNHFSPFTPQTPFTRSISHPVTPLTPYYTSSGSQEKEGNRESLLKQKQDVGHGQENAEEIGRYLLIDDIPKDLDGSYIKDIIKSIANFKVIIIKNLKTKGSIIVAFYDPREAEKVHRHLHANTVAFQEGAPRLALHCRRIDRRTVDTIAEQGDDWDIYWSFRESVIVIEIIGSRAVTMENMQNCLKQIGEVQRVQQVGHDGMRFIAEFWDTRVATEAIAWLNGPLGNSDTYVTARYLAENTYPSLEPRGMRRVTSGPSDFTLGSAVGGQARLGASSLFRPHASSSASGDVFGPYAGQSTPAIRPMALDQPSPTEEWLALRNRSSSSRNQEGVLPHPYGSYDHISPMQVSSRRSSEAGAIDTLISQMDLLGRNRREDFSPRFGIFNKKAIPPDNRVHPDRLVLGQDPRTTVMIKDVPNKLSREELVHILRESVPGGFDFVYLRFDFKNACNVGYAFVNFTSLQSLYEFYKARVGKRWNLFSSEKVLQICYADIQGKERLINKFRNSDVMTAPECWRPQIFYSEGSRRGQPEPFPEPDHPAMRMRSGLSRLPGYSPSAGTLTFDDSGAYDYTTADFDQAYGY